MDQKLIDSSQCREFILALIRDKKFETIEGFCFYLYNNRDNFDDSYDEFTSVEMEWGDEVADIDEKEYSF